MLFAFRLTLTLTFLNTALFSEKIETFYGTIEVEEPVLIELIHSPCMQRLKSIHQYGVSYYTTHREEYNRFDHSIGVFTLLKAKGASLEEQIAGLLHDVSHTAFSHVGDWVFGKEYQEEDFQTTVHERSLSVSGAEKILNKYGYTVEQISPKKVDFIMLEQPLPNLSADRLDYNIQGAYFQNFLTKQEALDLFQDLKFEDEKWILTRKDLAAKLTRFSLFMTEDCWGSALNYVSSRWLADAILKGFEIGLISMEEFLYGTDDPIWEKLHRSEDPLIAKRMLMILNPHRYYRQVSSTEANLLVKFRCRGIDPWILDQEGLVRLTSIDEELKEALQNTKEHAANGWALELLIN